MIWGIVHFILVSYLGCLGYFKMPILLKWFIVQFTGLEIKFKSFILIYQLASQLLNHIYMYNVILFILSILCYILLNKVI